MSTSNAPDFTATLDALIGRSGAPRPQPQSAPTIEEALARPQEAPTVSVGVQRDDTALPIPHPDMTLGEMKELMGKLAEVVDKGAYLYEWTGGKGAKHGNLDPVEVGIERMTEEERIAYHWWQANGDKDEYDWTAQRKTGTVPPGKVTKYNNELGALRYMYGKGDLEMEHWFWLRANSDARAHVVWALTKIIAANQDLVNGRDSSDALGMAEYQTALKIISESSNFVRVFMENVHKALKPIDTALNKVIARKIAVGKRIGIKQKVEGTANKLSEKYGGGKVGIIDNPDNVPRGKRKERDTTATIDELRRLKIPKHDSAQTPITGLIVPPIAKASGGMDVDPDTGVSAQGLGAIAPTHDSGDITEEVKKTLLQFVVRNYIDDTDASELDRIKRWQPRRALIARQVSKARAQNLSKILVPASASLKERVVVSAASAAVARGLLTLDQVETWVNKAAWMDVLHATRLFTEEDIVAQAIATLPTLIDA